MRQVSVKLISVLLLFLHLPLLLVGASSHAEGNRPCGEALSEIARSSDAYFARYFGRESLGGYTDKAVRLLFDLRDRASNSATDVALMADEARLISEITGRRYSRGDRIGYRAVVNDVLIRAYRKTAIGVSQIFKRNHPELDDDDLDQAAMVGLMTAVRTFDDPKNFETSFRAEISRALETVTREEKHAADAKDFELLERERLLRLAQEFRRTTKSDPSPSNLARLHNDRYPDNPINADSVLLRLKPVKTTTEKAIRVDPPAVSAEDAAAARERSAVLAKVIMTTLNEDDRELLAKFYGLKAVVSNGRYGIIDGPDHSVSELAAAYEVDSKVIHSRVTTARQRLERVLFNSRNLRRYFVNDGDLWLSDGRWRRPKRPELDEPLRDLPPPSGD